MAKDDILFPAREKTYFVGDPKIPNLYVKVLPTGHRTYLVRCRVGKEKSKREIKIGDYSKITVQMAREKAKKVIADIIVGNVEPAKPKGVTFKAAADLWLKNLKAHGRDASYIENCDRIIRLHLNPTLGDLYVSDVHRPKVVDIMDKMVDAGKPDLARKVRGTVSMVLNYAIERGWIEVNVTNAIKNKTASVKRERVLSTEELRSVIQDFSGGELAADTRDVLTVLTHTGQRRGEVLGIPWGEIDFEAAMWRLPGSRTKNGVPNNVPLTPTTLAIFKARRPKKIEPDQLAFEVGDYTVGQACRRTAARLEIPSFSPHDFRRTLASTLPRVYPKANEDLIRKIINHTSGRGALAHYAHYAYDDEKREALNAWSKWIESL